MANLTLNKMIGRIKLFLLESREEFKRVNWPTRKEAAQMVFVVVVFSLVISVFLATLDYFFLSLLEKILKI